MLNFNIGALPDWRRVAVGELLAFEMPTNGYRAVQFDLMADVSVAVHAVTPAESYLVAVGEGALSVRLSTGEPFNLVVMGNPDANVFIRTRDKTQVVAAPEEPTFTTIEPRQAGPSDELRRMMHVMRLNERRREGLLRAEIAALRRGREAAPLVENDPPAPAPQEPPVGAQDE